MQTLLIYLPVIVIIAAVLFYNSPLMILLFIVSLIISAASYYHCEDHTLDDLGAGLSIFCALGAAVILYGHRSELNTDAAFVLFASVIVITKLAKSLKK